MANGRLPAVARYATTGAGGLALNTGLLLVLVELGGIPRTPAAVLSAALTLTLTYVVTDRWVFAEHDGAGGRGTLLRYYTTMVTGKSVNVGIYVGLVHLGVWYPLAWIAGSVIVFVGTYLTNRAMWRRRAA